MGVNPYIIGVWLDRTKFRTLGDLKIHLIPFYQSVWIFPRKTAGRLFRDYSISSVWRVEDLIFNVSRS